MAFIAEPDLGKMDYFHQEFGDAADRLPYTALRSLGYDDETDSAYFLEVIFDRVPGAVAFSFLIREQDRKGRERRHWRGNELKDLFSADDRAAIRNDLIRLALAAVLAIQPQSFHMITIDRDMPPKALSKYETLAAQFEIAGYNITSENVHGQRIWSMIREHGAEAET